MYNLTRQEAADKLKISTRSIDRYIRSWKLRAKKVWKIIYIHNLDIENISWDLDNQEVIMPWDGMEEPMQDNVPTPRSQVVSSNTVEKINTKDCLM